MVETPLTFFEVEEEAFLADAAKFEEAEFGVAPKGFDAVDVILATGELVLMMMDAMVFVALENEAVVSLPAVGINVAAFDDAPFENRHQVCLRAVFDHAHEHPLLAFMKAQNRCFSTGSAPSFAANQIGSKIAFIDLDITNKRAGLLKRQGNDALPQ